MFTLNHYVDIFFWINYIYSIDDVIMMMVMIFITSSILSLVDIYDRFSF